MKAQDENVEAVAMTSRSEKGFRWRSGDFVPHHDEVVPACGAVGDAGSSVQRSMLGVTDSRIVPK